MMNYEKIAVTCMNSEDYPWVPFVPHNDKVFHKILKADPISGTLVTILKAPGNLSLPRHHHSGIVIVYTIKGAWKYKEHDWIAREGSVVYETAGTVHTPVGATDDEVMTFTVLVGDLIFLDDQDKVFAIENWKSAVERYLNYCKGKGIKPIDITSFSE